MARTSIVDLAACAGSTIAVRRRKPSTSWHTEKQHPKKASAAAELHRRGVLPYDFSSTLRLLNEARKVATYEGDEPELEGRDLEAIAADVETAVELAEQETSS